MASAGAQYVSLFLVLAVNSKFYMYVVTWSYSSHPFLSIVVIVHTCTSFVGQLHVFHSNLLIVQVLFVGGGDYSRQWLICR